MWPLDLYTIVGAPTVGSVATVTASGGELEAYRSIEPLLRMGIQFAGALLIAMVALGLCHRYGTNAVAKSRRSPIISICIGLPSLLVIGGLASTGYLIVDTSVGTFFGIPLVILGATVLPAATAVGITAIGRTVASRLGDDRLSVGVLAGALLCGIAGLALPATIAFAGLAASLGIGASIRVLFSATGAAHPDERTVPPANKI